MASYIHGMLNIYYHCWKAVKAKCCFDLTLICIENHPLRKKLEIWMIFCVFSFFFCFVLFSFSLSVFSPWERKYMNIIKAHFSGYCLRCCGFCSFGRWCIPGVHPANRSLGQSFYSSWPVFLCHGLAPELNPS